MKGRVPRLAMALAAGLGKRMRPLTETTPKPLLAVAGRTMLDRILDRFEEVGVERVVVNLHHHRGVIEAHLRQRQSPPIVESPEPELLETGGGVRNALGLLGPDPFYVCNGDILWLDGPRPALRRLAEAWEDRKMDALLMVHPVTTARGYEGQGDFFVDALGRMRRRRGTEVAPFVFAGLQILHPRLFADAPPGAFSLNVLYGRAEAAGRLYAIVNDGMWFHVGTPADLAATEAEIATGIRRYA